MRRQRIAIAVEVEMPAGVPLDRLYVSALSLGCLGTPLVGAGVYELREAAGEDWRVVRSEIHPDPDAVFPPDSER